MAVELPNGRTLVVGGQPILKIDGCCPFVFSGSFPRRAFRSALFPLFPATIGRWGTRQAIENTRYFNVVPLVPRVPRRFEHRSLFAKGSKRVGHASRSPNRRSV